MMGSHSNGVKTNTVDIKQMTNLAAKQSVFSSGFSPADY